MNPTLKKMLSIKIKDNVDKIEMIFILQAMFSLAGSLVWCYYSSGIYSLVKTFFLLPALFYFLWISVKRLYYTFWTVSILIVINEISVLFFSDIEGLPYAFYFLKSFSLAFILGGIWVLNSPLYYPRVHWWEYDFRFRNDFKIMIHYKEEKFEGRLSDLRRGAGCLTMFRYIGLGEKVSLIFDTSLGISGEPVVEILSKRESLPGRPRIYGVKFNIDDEKYRKISYEWKRFKDMKRKLKSGYAQKKELG